MIEHRDSGVRAHLRHRSSGAVLLTVGVLGVCAAVYVTQLHVLRGPAQQSINVRWAPDTSELARRTSERALGLQDAEEPEPGRWVYRVEDHSRESIRRIVTHPRVADTGHIDRQAFRILIDAPGIPAWLRTTLAADLGLPLASALAAIGFFALWLARGELLVLGAGLTRVFSGHEVAVAVSTLILGFGLFYDNGHGVDENIHYDQIVRFAGGDWSLNPSLTMLPGFHALVAGLVWATGGVTPFSVRLAVFLLSLATVGVFHALARTLQPEHAGMRTLQFALLPILIPQFFLIYTDVASLLFVLLMMLTAARRQYWSAGVLGLLSCLMRQNNVLWVAFALSWSYLRDYGFTWRPLGESLSRYWTFVATGAGFLLFVAVNEGQVAIGADVDAHPLGALHFTNIFFLLFLCAFLFLPLAWGYRREVTARMRNVWPWLSLLGLFPVFWYGFVNDHPYNSERPDYFLPNGPLIYFSSTALRKLVFFVPVAFAWLCVTAVPMKKPWWLLLPFTIVFLLPEWLVVPRYYLIPLSLFLLARAQASPRSERLQTALFAAVSIWLFLTAERGWGWV